MVCYEPVNLMKCHLVICDAFSSVFISVMKQLCDTFSFVLMYMFMVKKEMSTIKNIPC